MLEFYLHFNYNQSSTGNDEKNFHITEYICLAYIKR